MKICFLFSILFLLLSFVGAKHSHASDLVVVGHGEIEDVSRCGNKSQKNIAIPMPEGIYGYSHTQVDVLSTSGNRNYKTTYNSETRIVTVNISTESHSECMFIGPFSNKPRSWIKIRYTVFAKNNACDPELAIPNPSLSNVVDYQSVLEQKISSKECSLSLVKVRKEAALIAFASQIKAKAENGYQLEKVAKTAELAKIQNAKNELTKYRKSLDTINRDLLSRPQRAGTIQGYCCASSRRDFKKL